MTRMLTTGDIRRHMLRLALPLLFGNLLQQMYNTVDALIIGRFLGSEPFAAIGVAGTVMNLFIFILHGFCSGIGVVFGQSYGSGDRDEVRRLLFVSLTFFGCMAFCVSGLCLILLRPILLLLQTPADLLPLVSGYLRVIILGMIITYAYNLCSGLLNNLGDTRPTLVFLFISVVLNIGLDLLFVGRFGMGIAGCAEATVIAQTVSAVGSWTYLCIRYRHLLPRKTDAGLHPRLIRLASRYGATAALQESSLYIGKMFVQSAVNLSGLNGIAAYTAATRIEGFTNSFGDSGGLAAAAIIAQNYGARNKERIRTGLKEGLRLNLILIVFLSAIMILFARPLISLFFTGNEGAVAEGVAYLRMVSCFYFLCFIGCIFVGYYRGIGMVSVPVLGTTMHIALRAVLSFVFVPIMGLRGVGLATGLGWVLVVAYQLIVFKRRGHDPLPETN